MVETSVLKSDYVRVCQLEILLVVELSTLKSDWLMVQEWEAM